MVKKRTKLLFIIILIVGIVIPAFVVYMSFIENINDHFRNAPIRQLPPDVLEKIQFKK